MEILYQGGAYELSAWTDGRAWCEEINIVLLDVHQRFVTEGMLKVLLVP